MKKSGDWSRVLYGLWLVCLLPVSMAAADDRTTVTEVSELWTGSLYNRFIRWSRMGVFNKIFAELVEQNGSTTRLMIDSTHLKAHRTAASLLKKGAFPDVSDVQKAA